MSSRISFAQRKKHRNCQRALSLNSMTFSQFLPGTNAFWPPSYHSWFSTPQSKTLKKGALLQKTGQETENRARKKPININILGGTVFRDKHEPSLGQTGPLPDKLGPVPGTNGLFLFNSTVKSPFCPVCPWDGWGFVPGTIVPQGPSEKCLCVFCLLVFFFAPRKMFFFHPAAKESGKRSLARK